MPSQADRPTDQNPKELLGSGRLGLRLYAVADNSVEVQPTKCVHVATRFEKVAIPRGEWGEVHFFRMVSNLFMTAQSL